MPELSPHTTNKTTNQTPPKPPTVHHLISKSWIATLDGSRQGGEGLQHRETCHTGMEGDGEFAVGGHREGRIGGWRRDVCKVLWRSDVGHQPVQVSLAPYLVPPPLSHTLFHLHHTTST